MSNQSTKPKMMCVIRMIEYEGPEERMEKQLGGSMPDGVRTFGQPEHMTIRVTTVLKAWAQSFSQETKDATE